jgi:hypothetical protein
MSQEVLDVVRQQATEALTKLDVQEIVSAEHVADSVLRQAAYWEKPLANDEKLLFVRFFSPVVQREEVFLGNVLFNAFLSKAFARVVVDHKLGRVELVANDLQNYYFLLRTTADLAVLREAFRTEVERSLPDLFFGEQNEEKGIYGSLETMLDFDKANVEPFPVFIMPQIYAERLEKAVRASLVRKIEKTSLDHNPTSIMANLAFFYSHDGQEMQSPYLFLARLALRYSIVEVDDLRQALALGKDVELKDEAVVKTIIENSLKQKEGCTFSSAHLRGLLQKAVTQLGKKIDEDPDQWLMPYIRGKFLSSDEKSLMDSLLEGVSLSYVAENAHKRAVDIGCRICGTRPMAAEDKSILMGQNTHRFHNQSGKQKNSEAPKTCLRCAASTYLMVKLLGSEAVGQPQVPKAYNLVFHYGQHTDAEVDALVRKLDLIWERVRTHQQKERDVESIRKAIRNLEEQSAKQKSEQKKQELRAQFQAQQTELEKAESELKDATDDLFSVCPWLAAPSSTYEIPSLDLLTNIQSQGKIDRHVLGLGMGGYRMILFVLPQIRAPRDKEHDFAQSRFSHSRVTVTALLSFLRELCGCGGPFYYQSLPTLTPDAFRRDTFYVRDEPVNVEQAQNEYEAVTQLAWKLIWQRGSDGFVRKVVLAEKLLEDPLGTFASVMRDSPILGVKVDPRKPQYKRLPGGWREDWRAQDLTEYAKFIQRLSRLQEGTEGGA